jgi:hypothetical protein
MRNTQTIKNFVYKWKDLKEPNKNILYEYKPICKNLLYEDEDLVLETIEILKRNIKNWSQKYSEAYKNNKDFFSKQDLLDKSKWFVDFIKNESQPMATNGSTTGFSFPYLRWEPFLYFIEADNHYDLILDEFEISQQPNILYFFNNNQYDASKYITVKSDSKNFMEHHGTSRIANVHYVNFDRFKKNQQSFFEYVLFYLLEHKMDVIFAPGPSINSMCHFIRKLYPKVHKICKLLSNSNERLLSKDINFLFNGYVEDICDHMRCWDGGATFFTCKYKNYHLLDNLSWCESIDGKLISTDYFSLPSPFVNYWNGDFCRITNKYKRCECGRIYRDFEFLENRPFSLKGKCIIEIKKTLEELGVKGIKQVRCSVDSIDIILKNPLKDTHKDILRGKHGFKFNFIVEK